LQTGQDRSFDNVNGCVSAKNAWRTSSGVTNNEFPMLSETCASFKEGTYTWTVKAAVDEFKYWELRNENDTYLTGVHLPAPPQC
jgi:hypothetical protein